MKWTIRPFSLLWQLAGLVLLWPIAYILMLSCYGILGSPSSALFEPRPAADNHAALVAGIMTVLVAVPICLCGIKSAWRYQFRYMLFVALGSLFFLEIYGLDWWFYTRPLWLFPSVFFVDMLGLTFILEVAPVFAAITVIYAVLTRYRISRDRSGCGDNFFTI